MTSATPSDHWTPTRSARIGEYLVIARDVIPDRQNELLFFDNLTCEDGIVLAPCPALVAKKMRGKYQDALGTFPQATFNAFSQAVTYTQPEIVIPNRTHQLLEPYGDSFSYRSFVSPVVGRRVVARLRGVELAPTLNAAPSQMLPIIRTYRPDRIEHARFGFWPRVEAKRALASDDKCPPGNAADKPMPAPQIVSRPL